MENQEMSRKARELLIKYFKSLDIDFGKNERNIDVTRMLLNKHFVREIQIFYFCNIFEDNV